MSATVHSESLGQARPAFDTRKYMRHIVASGMPQEQADALIELLNAALENVVTKDDLKHKLDGLEASVKSYADKLSKNEREFLITFTTNMVDQLRADMNARFDELGKRVDKIGEELAESRKENKEILKEMSAIEIRSQERDAAAERRHQDREDAAEKRRQDREDAAKKHQEEQQAKSDSRRDQRARDNRHFVAWVVGLVSALVTALVTIIIAVLEYLS